MNLPVSDSEGKKRSRLPTLSARIQQLPWGVVSQGEQVASLMS